MNQPTVNMIEEADQQSPLGWSMLPVWPGSIPLNRVDQAFGGKPVQLTSPVYQVTGPCGQVQPVCQFYQQPSFHSVQTGQCQPTCY